jgi:hypothetical protein
MKTKLILFSLLLIAGISVKAQFKKYTFGLKAAPQIAWMKPNVDGYKNDGAKLGFSWGFVSEFSFSENHCIATGFNVVFNGGKLSYTDSVASLPLGEMSRTYSFKSIEVPITLKMRTNAIGKIKYYGQIGFGTSFRFGAKSESNFTYGSTIKNFPKANYDDISFLRESLIVGLGGEYTLNAGTVLSVGLALNNGFTDILTGKNNLSVRIKEKATTNFVELNVAVLF